MTTFWVWVLLLPWPSEYVHVTTVVPCAVMGKTVVVVPVTSPTQLSVAVGAVNVVTEHSAVTSGNIATSGTGLSSSTTVTVIDDVDVFRAASVAVYIMVVTPLENVYPPTCPVPEPVVAPDIDHDRVAPPQLSEKVASAIAIYAVQSPMPS